MASLMDILKIDVNKYDMMLDPTVGVDLQNVEWTIYENDLKNVREIKKNLMKSKRNNSLQLPRKPRNDNLA